MRTPEIALDSRTLRYIDLFCARAPAEQRITGDDVVVIVLFLALLLRFLYMCATLEANFVGKQLAIYLSVMAGDLQGTLRAGGIVGQQCSIEKSVAPNGESRIAASNIEKNIGDGEAAREKDFGVTAEVKSSRYIEDERRTGRSIQR